MDEKSFRMFLAIVIAIMLVAIGWAIYDHHYHKEHDGFHINVPNVNIDWNEYHRNR